MPSPPFTGRIGRPFYLRSDLRLAGTVATARHPVPWSLARQDYFSDLAAANAGTQPFLGMMLDHLRGGCLDAYKQVVNVGLPAGLVPVHEAIATMQAACRQAR